MPATTPFTNWRFFAVPNSPWTLAAPVLLGMSLDGAYTTAGGHNSPFGYVSGGLKASYTVKNLGFRCAQ